MEQHQGMALHWQCRDLKPVCTGGKQAMDATGLLHAPLAHCCKSTMPHGKPIPEVIDPGSHPKQATLLCCTTSANTGVPAFLASAMGRTLVERPWLVCTHPFTRDSIFSSSCGCIGNTQYAAWLEVFAHKSLDCKPKACVDGSKAGCELLADDSRNANVNRKTMETAHAHG